MEKADSRNPNMAVELALLLLAALWGASYTFIKLGVATIPPVTLIAARTLIAGLLLLAILRARGLRMPGDAATWRRFLFQALSQQRNPLDADRLGRAFARRGPRDHSQLHVADLHVLPGALNHAS